MSKLATLREVGRFLGTRKRYWLVPLILVLVLLGVLLVFAEGSAVAPFIYTLF
jgi:hypothetical protein